MSDSSLPSVLITNDDGVESPGIKRLVAVLGETSWCRVYVCAPHEERSAVGHGITLRDTLEANLLEDYAGAALAYSLSGTPADCTSLGISGQLFAKPVLVLSGINKGGNSGIPVIYSGTVAGAREAHIAGVPALAISLDWSESSSDELFDSAARVCLPLIQAALQASVDGHFPRDFFLNVNVPVQPSKNKGFRLTQQSLVNIGFKWDVVERRTGQQVAAGRAGGALPGMVPGSPVALPGMGRAGPPPLALAQLGSAIAARGASRSAESAVEDSKSDGAAPRRRLHFRHVTLAWEKAQPQPNQDIAALASGFITITPLALLTAAPQVDAAQEFAPWLSSLLV